MCQTSENCREAQRRSMINGVVICMATERSRDSGQSDICVDTAVRRGGQGWLRGLRVES